MEGHEFIEKAVPMFNSLTYNDQNVFLRKFLSKITRKQFHEDYVDTPNYKQGYKDGWNEALTEIENTADRMRRSR